MAASAGRLLGALVFVAATVVGRPVAAQAPVEDPATRARFAWGPLFFSPALVVKEIGVDSNVTNDPDRPQEDVTATISPRLLVGVRLGAARLSATSVTDYVWYRRFVGERSVNSGTEVRFDLLASRVRPFVLARFVDTRERPGYEIDARARRAEPTYGAGVDLRFGGRTTLVATVQRQVVDFAAGETFRGVELERSLDRETRAALGSVRVTLTPFTTVVVSGGREEARFAFSPLRDADSTRLVGSVEFRPEALLNGGAQVGFRRFRPRSPLLSGFDGLVAAVNLGYTLLGVTRFGVAAERDLSYSFEDEEPYYVQSGVGVTVTQQIGGPFDLTAGVQRRWLTYRVVAGAAAATRSPAGARRDTVDVATAGVGVRLGSTARLGVTAEYAERRSNSPRGRPFERLKLFASLTYQFASP